jgi:hypothetical protein
MRNRIRAVLLLATALCAFPMLAGAASASPKWGEAVLGPLSAKLYGTSCISATFCEFVGESEFSRFPLAVEFTGAKLEVQNIPSPEGAKEIYLRGVSCTSTKACTAVGGYVNSAGTLVTLAESWNGTEWKVETTANPTGAKASVLYGVKCAVPKQAICIAVGDYTNSEGVQMPLVDEQGLSGGAEWVVQTPPAPAEAKESKLEGVSCTETKNACTAVGYYSKGSGKEQLAERWNGTEWKVQTMPTGALGTLKGVSCASATACVAVGAGGTAVESESYPHNEGSHAMQWNGTEWKAMTLPAELVNTNGMYGVSCEATTSCIAVGQYTRKEGAIWEWRTYAMQWNGTEWTKQFTPTPFYTNYEYTQLLGVSCWSTEGCAAAGAGEFEGSKLRAMADIYS